MGHINLNAIKHLKQSATGVDYINLEDISSANTSLDNCTVCIQSKLTRNISRKSSSKVEAYLDLIYIDIGGSITPEALDNYEYYITFRDAYTKYLVIKLLRSRINTVNVTRTTIEELESEAKDNSNSSNIPHKLFKNNKVKALHLDSELTSKELLNYLENRGVKIRYSAPYTAEQNSAADIINRVILSKVRALLLTSNLPTFLWAEFILAATYLYHRTPNSSIGF